MAITFTRAWEDDRLDAELLRVERGQRVLVIAGAGDTALALAAAGAAVTAVDRNPDQLRLLALKLAVARTLEPGTAHRWFEAGHDPGAADLYLRRVRSALADDDAAHWDREIRLVARGLHRSSDVGRAFLRLGLAARLLAPGLAREVDRTPDPAAQLAWWRKHVRHLLDNRLTHAAAARTGVLAAFAPDTTEARRMRGSGWSHGLVDRVDGIIGSVLVREHPWWRPAFGGRPVDPGHGAAWLDEDRFATLGTGSTVRLVEGDLAAVLGAQPARSLDAVSVSNVPDWIDDHACTGLARAAAHALAPGGCLLVRRVVGPAADPFASAGLVRDPISDTLPARDRTALYERVDLYRAPA